MNADQIMDALGSVKEDYILASAPGRKKTGKPKTFWIAAAVAAVMLLTFFRTAPGAAALERARVAVADLIEILFPPKDIEITLEGEREAVPHEAGGQEPLTPGDGTAATPGFAIYYDPERYVMTEENGATYIRQMIVLPARKEVLENNKALFEGLSEQETEEKINALLAQQEEFYANLPVCEIEIVHLPDVQADDAAQTAWNEAAGMWERVTEVMESEVPAGYSFSTAAGGDWNSPLEQVCFASDGQNGTFRITARYFLEAAEGHGTRFMHMLRTFTVIAP